MEDPDNPVPKKRRRLNKPKKSRKDSGESNPIEIIDISDNSNNNNNNNKNSNDDIDIPDMNSIDNRPNSHANPLLTALRASDLTEDMVEDLGQHLQDFVDNCTDSNLIENVALGNEYYNKKASKEAQFSWMLVLKCVEKIVQHSKLDKV